MLLIKMIEHKTDSNGRYRPWAVFYCPYCNKEVEKYVSNGRKSESCGCIRYNLIANKRRTHGKYPFRLYEIWRGMKTRCYNTKDMHYKRYGERGIKVCDEWMKYLNFRDWSLNNGYNKNLIIDRINNDGNYEPSNCRWTDHKISSQNTSLTKLNPEKVKKIRNLFSTGKYKKSELGRMFNVSSSAIKDVVIFKTWKNIF